MQKTLRVNSFFIPSDVFSAQCKILIYIDMLRRFRMKVDPHVMWWVPFAFWLVLILNLSSLEIRSSCSLVRLNWICSLIWFQKSNCMVVWVQISWTMQHKISSSDLWKIILHKFCLPYMPWPICYFLWLISVSFFKYNYDGHSLDISPALFR